MKDIILNNEKIVKKFINDSESKISNLENNLEVIKEEGNKYSKSNASDICQKYKSEFEKLQKDVYQNVSDTLKSFEEIVQKCNLTMEIQKNEHPLINIDTRKQINVNQNQNVSEPSFGKIDQLFITNEKENNQSEKAHDMKSINKNNKNLNKNSSKKKHNDAEVKKDISHSKIPQSSRIRNKISSPYLSKSKQKNLPKRVNKQNTNFVGLRKTKIQSSIKEREEIDKSKENSRKINKSIENLNMISNNTNREKEIQNLNRLEKLYSELKSKL